MILIQNNHKAQPNDFMAIEMAHPLELYFS